MSNYQVPYYMNTGMQNPFGYNYQQPMQPQMPPQMQPQIQKMQQSEPMYKQPICLQGKSVDSVDVVKAMDIPLDGTISYFPLTDGSAIVTKQLQQDGTSKTIIYKPESEKEGAKLPKFVTMQEFEEAMKKNNSNEFREDIKLMKRQVKDLMEDIKEINEYISKRKD